MLIICIAILIIIGIYFINKITIPRAKAGTSGENFEIIVGFVLTPEQREFNTQGKRFRVSVGQS